MKVKHLITILAVLAAAACSKEPGTVATLDYKKYFDAWLENKGYDKLPRTPLGSYIMEERAGSGPAVDNGRDTLYVRLNYTGKSIDGKVLVTTDDSLDRVIGGFDTTYFYGPRIMSMIRGKDYAGVIEAVRGMNVGGYRKVIIPGWLMTTDVYGTMQEYIDNSSGTEAIYEFEPVETINDIRTWEVDSLCNFVRHFFKGEVNPADTVESDNNRYGFYYRRTVAPKSESSMLKDTTIYINYTCYTLDGRVVDTTDGKLAKDAGFDVSKKSYGPVSIHMNETHTSIKMGTSESSAIQGFTLALSKMHPYESGTAVFYSDYAYKSQGSGSRIPPYASLRFDIDVVDKPR